MQGRWTPDVSMTEPDTSVQSVSFVEPALEDMRWIADSVARR